MWYTQLDFAGYSPNRRTLFSQAKWLLHELIEDRHHGSPCDCGACIYAAYRKRKKNEGRSFSKRTFFVFFLWMDYFTATFYDKRLSSRGLLETFDSSAAKLDSAKRLALAEKLHLEGRPQIFHWQSSLAKRAEKKRGDILVEEGLWSFKEIWKLGKRRRLKIIKKLDRTYSTDIFRERVEYNTRKRTRTMIKKLAENEKSRRAKTFLRGILNKKCFYTYYARAADRNLYNIAFQIRRDLSKPHLKN